MIQFPELGKKGRLGNQLFQIAATIGTAAKYNVLPGLPEWRYKKDFSIPQGIFGSIKSANSTHSDEDKYHYSEIPYQYGKVMNLTGYFQSPRYWEGNEELIRSYFNANDTEVIDLIGVHVRRGDYCRFNQHYAQLFEEGYYQKAMRHFSGDNFLFFSDDIEFCRDKFGYSVRFSESIDEVEDLKKMSKCKGLIMANSSYSWWGGYLGRHGRKIITPARWFGPALSSHSTKDLYLPEWIKCE